MQHSVSSPAEMHFTANDNNNHVHPLYSPGAAQPTLSFLDTKSMTSLPLPRASSSASSSAFYTNHPSSKSMVQVAQSTSTSSAGIRRNKTLPSKRSSISSAASSSSPSLPSYLPPSSNRQPSWLERSTSTSALRRERQQSMPISNQKTPVRRWKSIRTVPAMERDDLTTPIFTQ